MKPMLLISAASIACAMTAAGCSKDDPEPPASSMHEGGEMYAEPIEPEGDEVGSAEEPRRAEASFESAKGTELEGEVTLAETADGVQVSAKVESAPPGTLEVRLRNTEGCEGVIGEDSTSEPAIEAEVATFAVDNEGKGELTATVSGANLAQKGEPMSMLGKTLVIRKLSPEATPGQGKSPIACAKIEGD